MSQETPTDDDRPAKADDDLSSFDEAPDLASTCDLRWDNEQPKCHKGGQEQVPSRAAPGGDAAKAPAKEKERDDQ